MGLLDRLLGWFQRPKPRITVRDIVEEIPEDVYLELTEEEKIEIEQEAVEEIRRIEEAEVEEPISTEPTRLYRYSFAIYFSHHEEYHSIVAQGWSTDPNDTDMEELIKEEAIDRYQEVTEGYSSDEMMAHGASYEIDFEPWTEVRYDARLIGKIDSRIEYKSKRSFFQWMRKLESKWGF